jgi:hypothetical protein
MASPNTRIELLEKKVDLLMKEQNLPNLSDPTEAKSKKPDKPDKPKGKAKAKEDDDKPKKKRTSGYILYSNANRDEVRERLAEDAEDKPKNTDIVKELARLWKELDDDEKALWNKKAADAKDSDD